MSKSLLFNTKLIIGIFALGGVGIPFYFLYGDKCSFVKTSELQKISLDASESVLECQENGRNYSVYLASTENLGLQGQDISFKVVDNNSNKKIKWGLGSQEGDKWDDWGIAIYKDSSGKGKETKIRVPKRNVYSQDKVLIDCQKSKLKLKENTNACSGGSFLKNKNLKFEIDSQGQVKIQSENFDWSDDFKPTGLFCPH